MENENPKAYYVIYGKNIIQSIIIDFITFPKFYLKIILYIPS